MSELLYKDEVFKFVGLCMEVHRELGKGQDKFCIKTRSWWNCNVLKSPSHAN